MSRCPALAGDEFPTEDEIEAQTAIDPGEDEDKSRLEALKAELGASWASQREKESLQERLREQECAVEALKEKSGRVAARMRTELSETHQEARKAKSEVTTVERELARMAEEMKAVAEESHQTQIRA